MAPAPVHLVSRKLLYFSMAFVLAAIFFGAYHGTSPIYLAVGFIGEIILMSTAHLSSVVQHCGIGGRSSEATAPDAGNR